MQKKDIAPGALLAYRRTKGSPVHPMLAVGPHWVRGLRKRNMARNVYQLTEDGASAAGVIGLIPSHTDMGHALKTWASEGGAPEHSPITPDVRQHVARMRERILGDQIIDLSDPQLRTPEGWTWNLFLPQKLYKDYVEAVQAEAHEDKLRRKDQAEREAREDATRERMATIDELLRKAGIATGRVMASYRTDLGRDEDPAVTVPLRVLEELSKRAGLL